jgi:hypothetical protein
VPHPDQAASSLDTCLASQRSRPAGVRTPRASSSWAMALSVAAPVRWISAITARVVALALATCSDLAARALPIVSAPVGEPSLTPRALAAARLAVAQTGL